MSHPEPKISPPEPKGNPQVTRHDYVYQTPWEKMNVIRDTIIAMSEIASSLRWLNQSDPEAGENFPGAVSALNMIYEQLKAYEVIKVKPWL